MRIRPTGASVVALFTLSTLLMANVVDPALGADAASQATAQKASAWLATQQQSDGGFEVAGFPGFETPDAVLAMAEAAQTGSPWNTSVAHDVITGLHLGNGSGPTPLDALDDFVDAGITGGQAAKLVVLVVAPLGLDPEDFDPEGDSATAVDLTALVDPSGCAGDPANFGFFNQTLYGALAKRILCGTPNPAVLTTIRTAQRPDGGWNFLGNADDDPLAADSDVDTTALAIQALVAGGAAWNDPAIIEALAFLATQQTDTGAFEAFGSDDPNSTAVAIIAIAAAGFDPTTSCWRDSAVPATERTAVYADPAAWLRSQQQSNGRIASPNDGSEPNTFATSQTVEGLLRSWLPIVRATGAPNCVVTPPVSEPAPNSAPAASPVVVQPQFTG